MIILHRRILAAAAGAALLAASIAALPAWAAGPDCVLDRCADQAPATKPAGEGSQGEGTQAPPASPAHDVAPSRRVTPGALAPGAFDFYLLALSWSPGFCEVGGGQRPNRQCEPGAKLGFVVHGLWPQFERGYPLDCEGVSSPSQIALDHAKDLYPDLRLARYEWRKHGTCSGRSPSDYFADVARAREMIVIPTAFAKPDAAQTFSPIDIERAFIAANPRLRPGMLAIGCRRDVLEDVKLCLSKDLREFRACPEVVRRSCRREEIRVPALN